METMEYFRWNTKIYAITLIKFIYVICWHLQNTSFKSCIVIRNMELYINSRWKIQTNISLSFINLGSGDKDKKKYNKD